MRIRIDLTAKQERHLIQLGLAALTAQTLGTTTDLSNGIKRGPYKRKKKWSKEQHEHYARTMAEKWDGKRAEKLKPTMSLKRRAQISTAAKAAWTPARRRKYAATMVAQGKNLRKLATAAKLVNGKALHANGTTRQTNGLQLRHDGQPYKQPGKRWTPEHRRNFVRSYKKAIARKKALQARSKKALAKVMAKPAATTSAPATPLTVSPARHKASRPNAKWTDDQRKRFRETLAKKKAEGWVPKRNRGAQK